MHVNNYIYVEIHTYIYVCLALCMCMYVCTWYICMGVYTQKISSFHQEKMYNLHGHSGSMAN